MPEDNKSPLSDLNDAEADQLMAGARLAFGDWDGKDFFKEALKEAENYRELYAKRDAS